MANIKELKEQRNELKEKMVSLLSNVTETRSLNSEDSEEVRKLEKQIVWEKGSLIRQKIINSDVDSNTAVLNQENKIRKMEAELISHLFASETLISGLHIFISSAIFSISLYSD